MPDIEQLTDTVRIRYEPVADSDTAVIYLPGMSGDAFSDRFNPVFNAVKDAGFSLLRFQSWENTDQLLEKTVDMFYTELDEAVAYLHQHDIDRIALLGKSFSGGRVLTYTNPAVRGMVLWAPAIGVAEQGNLEEWWDTPFHEMDTLDAITVDADTLSQVQVPVLILHGSSDDVIPVETSEQLVELLPDAALETVSGATHSFDLPVYKNHLAAATLRFLHHRLL